MCYYYISSTEIVRLNLVSKKASVYGHIKNKYMCQHKDLVMGTKCRQDGASPHMWRPHTIAVGRSSRLESGPSDTFISKNVYIGKLSSDIEHKMFIFPAKRHNIRLVVLGLFSRETISYTLSGHRQYGASYDITPLCLSHKLYPSVRIFLP